MNKSQSKKALIFVILGGCLWLQICGWIRIFHEIDHQSYFCDETLYFSSAAFNFFTHFNYNSPAAPKPFDPMTHNGIMATWPSGVVWAFQGNLYIQRIFFSILTWLSVCLLGYFAGLKLFQGELKRTKSIVFATALWTVILWFPYWFGFMLNLGEFPAALFLVFGFLAHYKKYNRTAAFLWGLSVWHCKFITLPFVLAFLGGLFLLDLKFGLKKAISGLFSSFGYFILPLFIWMAMVAGRFGIKIIPGWIKDYIYWIVHGPSGLEVEIKPTFFERLQILEWGHLSSGTRFKILILLFGPVAIQILWFFKRKKIKFSTDAFLKATMVNIALLFLAYWYFFISSTMWTRHIQPALYIGLAFFVCFSVYFRQFQKKIFATIAITLLLSIIPVTVDALKKLPNAWIKDSYPRSCKGSLFTKECIPDWNF